MVYNQERDILLEAQARYINHDHNNHLIRHRQLPPVARTRIHPTPTIIPINAQLIHLVIVTAIQLEHRTSVTQPISHQHITDSLKRLYLHRHQILVVISPTPVEVLQAPSMGDLNTVGLQDQFRLLQALGYMVEEDQGQELDWGQGWQWVVVVNLV